MLGVKEYPYGVSSKFEKHAGGGIAKVVIDLVNELCKDNNDTEVTLIVRKMPGQPKHEFYGKVQIYRVPWINSRYLRMPVFALFSFFKALKIYQSYDIIHAHDAFAIFLTILLKKLNRRIITVSSPHGGPFTKESVYNSLATNLYRSLEKFNLKHSEHLVFLSDAEKNQLCTAYKTEPKKSYVIPTGISAVQVSSEQNDGKFNIVFIGRLMPRKGIDKLITAMSIMPPEILTNLKLTIVGDVHSKTELEEQSKKLNLENSVFFAGFSNEIARFLGMADLFVLPSEGGEGLPISVLEAMSARVPVMISNFDAPFREGSYYKLDNNEPKTIKSAITELYDDRARLMIMGERAFVEYSENFSISAAAKRFKNFYHSL